MSPSAPIEPTTKKTLPELSSPEELSPDRADLENRHRFGGLRGVQWRIDLGILPPSSSSIDDFRRVTANCRRRYAALRRRLLINPHISKDESNFHDLAMDNPLSQNPDSMWGRFFHKAELEKMVDQDLSRLYPEHVSHFQTPGCQGLLRRVLLLWCIRHPNYGYKQGMHELLAPLLYVLQADLESVSEVRKQYQDCFTDNFDGLSFNEIDSAYNSDIDSVNTEDDFGTRKDQVKVSNINELDPKIQTVISFSDAYGAEGELGVVLSEKFLEHDAYSLFDALMNGDGGAVAMANFFSHSPLGKRQNGLSPVLEASNALYHLLSIVDFSLYSHLVELGVEPQYFALRWLRVLFGREFALKDILVIWDEIFSLDNSILTGGSDTESDMSFFVLKSSRGAFISALAVSMILYLRSSLLATENATSCLQRLLNFPEDVNIGKLMKKAKSLMILATDAINSIPQTSKQKGHSLPSDPGTPGSPRSSVPESYWEEKWRVLQKEEEEKKKARSHKQVHNRIKAWSERVKMRLRAGQKMIGRTRSPVKRNLQDGDSKLAVEDDSKETFSSINGASEDNSSIFSDPSSPGRFVVNNDTGNETEGSCCLASSSSINGNNPDRKPAVRLFSSHEEIASPLPISDHPEYIPSKDGQNVNITDMPDMNLRDRRFIPGRFPWLWMFAKNEPEGSFGCISEPDGSSIIEPDPRNAPVIDQKGMCSLKYLAQSMMENIEVIESAFEHGKSHTDQQSTAMESLKELRKISNLLSEM